MSNAPWRILQGDVRKVARTLEENHFDAILSDPPYGLSFMSKRWDYFVPSAALWGELLRVVKPGARGIIFGGSRTFHRLVCALEDGGFVPTDQVLWLYGSGFPKSLNMARAVDSARVEVDSAFVAMRDKVLVVTRWVREVLQDKGLSRAQLDEHYGRTGMSGHWATQASQPQLMSPKDWAEFIRWTGSKPPKHVASAFAEVRKKIRLLERGKEKAETAFLSTLQKGKRNTIPDNEWKGHGTALKPAFEPAALILKMPDTSFGAAALEWGCGGLAIDDCRLDGRASSFEDNRAEKKNDVYGKFNPADYDGSKGRWPANLIIDDEVAVQLDAQYGEHKAGIAVTRHGGGNKIFNGANTRGPASDSGYSDEGGVSRYFYTAKASREEKELGLDDIEPQKLMSARVEHGGKGDKTWDGKPAPTARNNHPTVKPLALTRYMAKLLLPPKQAGRVRRILVPFSGVASEMIGCLQAGWDEVVGIELEPKYIAIAERRIRNGGVFSKLDKAFLMKGAYPKTRERESNRREASDGPSSRGR